HVPSIVASLIQCINGISLASREKELGIYLCGVLCLKRYMRVKKYHSINDFFEENLSFLEQQEAANNLLIGIPLSMLGEKEKESPPNLFAVLKNQKVVFSCVQTSPKNFMIYGESSVDAEVFDALIPVLYKNNIKAEGVIGPKNLALAFAKAWKKETGQDWTINFQQLVYQLDEVKELKSSKGSLRKATIEDLPLMGQWFIDFSKEAMNQVDDAATKIIAKEKIESETLYLWEDKAPVSMAAVARPTKNGITVNYVYTPPGHRGKGYASNCVSVMSKLMLKRYKFCCLFTDMANPTSNRIYQQIGYYPIAEFRVLGFL
ncbi:MAG: putative GNAT family acetyltransferase, partial [Saprospiraceae bacterium]